MNTITTRFLLAVFLLALFVSSLLIGCLPLENLQEVAVMDTPEGSSSSVEDATASAPVLPEMITAVPVDDPSQPENIALLFYRAYVEAQANFEPTIGSETFTEQAYLSKAYLKQIDEIKAGFDGASFDAVLQTQSVPPAPVEIKEFNIEGSQATVVIQFGRGVIETPWERIVSLEQIDGAWKIVPDQFKDGAKSPEETVQTFYNWYLGYIGIGGQMRNPLVDRAYRAAPYLNRGLVNKIDRQLEAGDGIGFDPFLCAQDVPTEIKIYTSYYNAARPVVVAQSSFAGHYLVVDLARDNFNHWEIRGFTCGSTPEGTAKAFYTWALGYMTQEDEMHNPWVNGAYRDNPFLTQAFIQSLDSRIASGEPLVADPLLLAQDVPQAFSTERCPEGPCALVNMQFGDVNIHQVQVDLQDEDGRLKINSIGRAPALESPPPAEPLVGVEHWVPFMDAQYGYGFRYPADWRVVNLKVTGTHTPQEFPQMRSIYFFSPELDGEYVPIGLDVLMGDAESMLGAYGFAEQVQKTELNGYPVTQYRSDMGIIYYVFQHPARPQVWLILYDNISQFAGREDMAPKVAGVIERMASTVVFSK